MGLFRRRRPPAAEPSTLAVLRGPGDDPSLSDEELVARRVAWCHAYTGMRSVVAKRGDTKYTCPCCGHPELDERGSYEICGECGWEDDGQDDHDSAVVRGGPNGRQSLDAARAAYMACGGTPGRHVPPAPPG